MEILLEKYLDYLKRKAFSPSTLKSVQGHLTAFLQFLKNHRKINDIKKVAREDIIQYQLYLENYRKENSLPLSSNTKYARMLRIKKFFQFLQKENLILSDPSRRIELPRLKKSLPRNILTKPEARRILRQPDTSIPSGFRDRAILETFYSTGVRLEELRSLSIYDVDIERGILRVSGKGGKERIIPLGKVSSRFIAEYLEKVRPRLLRDPSDKSLFISSKQGKKMPKVTLQVLVKTYAKRAGIKKSISPHSLRHTCATHLLQGRADIRYIQEILGHSRLDTTQIYTRVIPLDLKEAHKKYHPRERQKMKELIPFNEKRAIITYYKPRKKVDKSEVKIV